MATREERITALAEGIASEAGIGSRVVVLLLERAAREGFDLAIDEVAGS